MKRKYEEIKPGIFLSNDNLIRTDFDFQLLTPPPAGKIEINQAAEGTENENLRETDEYLIRKFRVLSAIIIRGKGYPLDYSKQGVLEKAAALFEGTLYKNHSTRIDEWVGLVKSPAYNTASNPPGVDCEFHIDKTLNQSHIVRGVKTGALNRCSAGLMFSWSQSHPDMKDRVFWDSLGEEVDGQEVRIVVEEILEVFEVSLVYFGADHTAKAHQAAGDDQVLGNKALSLQKINQPQENNIMKEKLIALIKMVKDSSITSRSLTTDADVEAAVKQLIEDFNALAEEKVQLAQENIELKKFQDDQITEVRQDCHRLSKIVHLGGSVPEIQKNMIDQGTYDQLKQYRTDFQAQADDKFPMRCEKCGSTMARRSSVEVNHEPEVKKEATVHNQAGDGGDNNTVHFE